MQPKRVESLQQRIARLRKVVTDKLGRGVWGLEEKDRFSREKRFGVLQQ